MANTTIKSKSSSTTTASPDIASATAPQATPSATPAVTPPPQPAGITSVANGGNRGTKVDLETSYQSLISGLLTFYQPTDVFALKSGDLTRDELVAELQKYIAAAEQTKASKAAWRSDVQSEREVELGVRPLRSGVRGILQAKFGRDGAQLLQFGFTPAKKPKKTVASKSQAVAKAKETRTLRGTKGKKQRLDVKAGAATSPTTAPGATPAATQPTPQPAPAPAAGTAPAMAPVALPVGTPVGTHSAGSGSTQ